MNSTNRNRPADDTGSDENNNKVKARKPVRVQVERRVDYGEVRCSTITWDDDDVGGRQEAKELRQVLFRKLDIWSSPFEIPNATDAQNRLENYVSTQTQVSRIQRELLIVHYTGHGESEANRTRLFGSTEVQTFPILVGSSRNDEEYEVNLKTIIGQLARCDKDVVVFLDCCCAAGEWKCPSKGVQQTRLVVVAACDRDTDTPAEYTDTFTRRLIKSLGSFKEPFNILQLVRRMIKQRPGELKPIINPDHLKAASEVFLTPGKKASFSINQETAVADFFKPVRPRPKPAQKAPQLS